MSAKVSDVDVVLDTIGGQTQQRSFDVLRSGGKLVSTVSPPDQAPASAHKVEGAFVFHTSNAGRLADLVKAYREKGHSVLIDGFSPSPRSREPSIAKHPAGRVARSS